MMEAIAYWQHKKLSKYWDFLWKVHGFLRLLWPSEASKRKTPPTTTYELSEYNLYEVWIHFNAFGGHKIRIRCWNRTNDIIECTFTLLQLGFNDFYLKYSREEQSHTWMIIQIFTQLVLHSSKCWWSCPFIMNTRDIYDYFIQKDME